MRVRWEVVALALYALTVTVVNGALLYFLWSAAQPSEFPCLECYEAIERDKTEVEL